MRKAWSKNWRWWRNWLQIVIFCLDESNHSSPGHLRVLLYCNSSSWVNSQMNHVLVRAGRFGIVSSSNLNKKYVITLTCSYIIDCIPSIPYSTHVFFLFKFFGPGKMICDALSSGNRKVRVGGFMDEQNILVFCGERKTLKLSRVCSRLVRITSSAPIFSSKPTEASSFMYCRKMPNFTTVVAPS